MIALIKKNRRKSHKQGVSNTLQRRLRESGLILSICLASCLLLSILTFSPADSAWSSVKENAVIHNAAGYVGAWIADLLLYLMGYMAYCVPVFILLIGGYIYLGRSFKTFFEPKHFTVVLVGIVFFISAGCALSSLHFISPMYTDLPLAGGGIWGNILAHHFLEYVNILGASLLLLGIFIIGITLFTGLSWMQTIETIGAMCLSIYDKIKTKMSLNKETSVIDYALTKEQGKDKSVVKKEDIRQNLPEDEANILFDMKPEPLFVMDEEEESDKQTVSVTEKILPEQSMSDIDTLSELSTECITPIDTQIEKKEVDAQVKPLFANMLEDVTVSQPDMAPLKLETTQHNKPEFTGEVTHNMIASFLPEKRIDERTSIIESIEDQEQAMLNKQESRSTAEIWDLQKKQVILVDDAIVLEEQTENKQNKTEQQENNAIEPQEMVAEYLEDDRVADSVNIAKVVIEEDKASKVEKKQFVVPPVSLLTLITGNKQQISEQVIAEKSRMVEDKLRDFKIKVEVVEVHQGPVINLFELMLAPGIKVSKITGLEKDLARALLVSSVRVLEVIPGKPTIGLEIPNEDRQTVYFSEILHSTLFNDNTHILPLILGHDINGKAVIADLAKMPHLLVAGTTGSGKSIGVNGMIVSLLFSGTPDDIRMIMIDPKMLELSVYDGIPHLLTPVVTQMKEAANALRWCVVEMERRYQLMSAMKVRNIIGFNKKLQVAIERGEYVSDPLFTANPEAGRIYAPKLEPLPYIVIIIDEFADMMMAVGKEVEELIARLTQKARAAGIHLILATQRPSVDVITGLIKANVPTRIAYQVSSRIDSRTILDQMGAENLLGRGDMLYLPPGTSVPQRVHGALISDDEVLTTVNELKSYGEAEYLDEIIVDEEEIEEENNEKVIDNNMDALYDEAIKIVTETRKASISALQRRLRIGFNRAARIIEDMEREGVVSKIGSNNTREVLAPPPVGNNRDE